MSSTHLSFPILPVTFLVGLCFFSNACTKEHIPEAPVCFNRDVQPIILANCTGSGCHNAIDRQAERDYSTFDGLRQDVQPGNYLRSNLYQVMTSVGGGVMPPKPNNRLNTDQLRTIATWIEQGATNDTCVALPCDTSGVLLYSADIQPVLQNNCVGGGCHSGSLPASGISYSTYASTKSSALNGSLLGSIQHKSGYSPMPKGGNFLPACSIAKIRKWIESGAPNN